ncbi:MAG TPA: hypothetical protein VLS49_02955 [Usitatibacter sp.]|nr:hypothetical protein [Usitatibacter sp.]
MPYRTCPKCKLGLSGIEGHREIVLDPRLPPGEAGRPRFQCALCGTYWRRNYVGDGLFLWNPDAPEPPLEKS